MAVGDGGEVEVFGEGFHRNTCRSSFLRGGPRMRLARFDKSEDGHEKRERGERSVAENCFDREGFGSSETTAVNLQAESVGAHNGGEESEHDQSDDGGPDAESPADEQQETETDFRERKRVRDELDAPRRKNLIGIHLQRKEGKGYSDRRARMHPHRQFGVAGIDEDTGKDEAADPDDGAA